MKNKPELKQDLYGTWYVEGDVGYVKGNVKGNVWGNVKGNVFGNVKGDVMGTINGRKWQFKKFFAFLEKQDA